MQYGNGKAATCTGILFAKPSLGERAAQHASWKLDVNSVKRPANNNTPPFWRTLGLVCLVTALMLLLAFQNALKSMLVAYMLSQL
jgi:hypothetical protein